MQKRRDASSPWLVLCAAVTLAACIPNRDNPNDPSNAPVAALRFADATRADGSCFNATTDSAALLALPPTLSIDHGRCLALIAFGSHTPSNSTAGLSYQFAVLGTAGNALTAAASSSTIDVEPPATLGAFPTGQIVKFQVTVRSQNGGVGFTAQPIQLGNEAPYPPVLHPVHLPAGGFPWAPGAPIPYHFDASSAVSPLGNAINSYCWTIAGQTLPCRPTADDPSFTVQIPSVADTRVVGTVHVCDVFGACSQPPVSMTVFVDQPLIWGVTTGLVFTPGLVQLDSEEQSHSFPAGAIGSFDHRPGILSGTTVIKPAPLAGSVVLIPGNPLRYAASWVEQDDNPFVAEVGVASFPAGLVSTSNSVVVGTVNIGIRQFIQSATLVPTQDGSAIWTEDGNGAQLFRLAVVGTTLTPASFPFQASDVFPAINGALTVDANGSAWISSADQVVYEINASGATQATFPEPAAAAAADGATLISLSARPGSSGEVWGSWLVGSGTSGLLTRYQVGAAELNFPLLEAASGINWIDSDLAWMVVGSSGLAEVDLAAVESGESIANATVLDFPGVVPTLLVTDPLTGDAWGLSNNEAFRASVDGSFSSFPSGGDFIPLFVDPGGDLWFGSGGSLFDAVTPDPATPNLLVTGFVDAGADASYDWTRGSALFISDPTTFPADLETVAPDGTVVGKVVLPQQGGTALGVWMDPGSASTGWYLTQNATTSPATVAGVFRANLGVSPPAFTPVTVPAAAGSLYVQDGAPFVFAPSAPVPGSTPFAWALTQATAGIIDLNLVNVSESGGATTVAANLTSTYFGLARSPASNGACLGEVAAHFQLVNPFTDVSLSWAQPGQTGLQPLMTVKGGPTLVGRTTVQFSGAAVAVSTGGGETCWIAYSVGLGSDAISGVRVSDGKVFGPINLPGNEFVTALYPQDQDNLWVATLADPGSGAPNRLYHYTQTATGFVNDTFLDADVTMFATDQSFPREALVDGALAIP